MPITGEVMGLNITRISQREWFLDVRVRRAGKECRKRETFYGTQAQAEERYFQVKRELKEGKPTLAVPPVSPLTFKDVLRLYRTDRGGIQPKDQCRYNRLESDLGPTSIAHLPRRMDEFLRLLRHEVSPRTKRPLSSGSINKFLIIAKAALNHAVTKEVIERNPITNGRFPLLRQVARDKVLTQEEIHRLLSNIQRWAPHIEWVSRFALQVPCRRSELVNMRREDLDLTHNAIRVRNGTTKNDQGIWKPIPPDMVDYFRSIPPECPWLFYRVKKGRFLPLGDFKRSWGRCLRLAGISGFRFHDTRHISATNLLDNGTPEQVVLQVAGWKTNMIRSYYHRSGKRSLALVSFSPGSGR